MSEAVGCGPTWPVDGPPPLPPLYGLLPAAAATAAAAGAVRIVTDTDGAGRERWLNGMEVRPYPAHAGAAHNPFRPGTSPNEKSAGVAAENPIFGAFTVYEADTCSTRGVRDEDAYQERIRAALAAVESAVVASQLLAGTELADTVPYLADGGGTFPAPGAVSYRRALALLETEIAVSRRRGVIHLSPYAAVILGQHALKDEDGIIRTFAGNLVVVDAGYADGATPVGKASPTSTQEWLYASGPVDIRRSDVFVVPGSLAEALERFNNDLTYRAERHYAVTWDGVVQAAVLADLCADDCPAL